MAGIEGIDDFRRFSDDLRDLEARIPYVLSRTVKMTAIDIRDMAIANLRKSTTSQGGTFDSRTSPYSPGGENDSSEDNFHLTDRNAWKVTQNVQSDTAARAILSPIPAVAERAKHIEYGTQDHGPDKDTPMYFNAYGQTIVVSDVPRVDEDGETNSLEEMFAGEPMEVSGVKQQNYLTRAISRAKAQNVMGEHLRKNFAQAIHNSGVDTEIRI